MNKSIVAALTASVLTAGSAAVHAESVVCEARGDRVEYCALDRNRDANVRLRQKLSEADCREGSSWGHDASRREIWVDRGCRAQFDVTYLASARNEDRCPPGHRPGRCSDRERPRCKDFRTETGLGCRTN